MRSPKVVLQDAIEPVPTFAVDVANVARGLRAALASLISSLPSHVRGGTDLQRVLDLGSTLAWQVYGVVGAANPVTAIHQLPGRASMHRFLESARRKGVPSDVIEAVSEAFDDFERCVERHAGDRASFASMVSGLAHGADSSIDLDARRDAFRAMSHLYGVQRRVSVGCCVIHPGSEAGRFDFVFVEGSIGLRVMRHFDRLCLSRRGYKTGETGRQRAELLPVEPPRPGLDAPASRVPLLESFCSRPLPRFVAERDSAGFDEFYVEGPAVGRTGELTYFLGERLQNVIEPSEDLNLGDTVMFPTEVMLLDVLVAPSLFERKESPDTGLYGNAISTLRMKRREADRLNTPVETRFLGVGAASLHTGEIPRYVEMLEYVCGLLGWRPDTFDAYRCRVDYPVLHAMLNISFGPRPASGIPYV